MYRKFIVMILPFTHNKQYVPMDDFAKFQPHQTEDGKHGITYGL